MNASTEIIKYTIVIIQSLKDDDLKTGEMLYDRLSTTLPIKYPDTSVKFYNVKDKRELAVTFYKFFNEIENGELVTLQIETHGCEEGIELASGELVMWKDVTWEQVANEIRELLTETYKRYYENCTYRDLIPNE